MPDHFRPRFVRQRVLSTAVALLFLGLFLAVGRLAAGEPEARPESPIAHSNPAAEPELERAKTAAAIESLVEALGDPRYTVRQRASRQISEIGAPAKSALLGALRSDDAEVRRRADLLLPAVLAEDFSERLAEFEAHADNPAVSLPGWKQYSAVAGNDRFARAFFVGIARSEPLLLEAIDQGKEEAARAIQGRCAGLQQQLWPGIPASGREEEAAPVTLGTVGAMLLAISDPEVRIDAVSQVVVLRLLSLSPVAAAMSSRGNAAAPLRRLTGRWISFYRGPREARRCLAVALMFGLAEGRTTAIRLLHEPNQPVDLRQMAILTIARFGTIDDLNVLAPLLADTAPCVEAPQGRAEYRQEVRDVALAAMIHLSGQEPAQYGFAEAKLHPREVFQPSSLRFASGAQRAAALAKWRMWYVAFQRGEVRALPPKRQETPALPDEDDSLSGD